MKSPSAEAYERGAQMAAEFAAELSRCRHPQAEPVVLSTGEQVACVCIGCYEQLPADHIEWQVEKAVREAYCAHETELSLRTWGDPRDNLICSYCGRIRED